MPAANPSPTRPTPGTPPSTSARPATLNWSYPFRRADNKEITNPQVFYEAAAGMDDGLFPLGVNGFPHGGVHFGHGFPRELDHSRGVRCIADGEIVAHRLDRSHPHLQFADGKWAAYSTSFVLVRHRLALPPAPNAAGAQPAEETHDIYSLYMHLADWYLYLADSNLPRPFWWDVEAYRIGDKDRQHPPPEGGSAGAAGAFVWTEPKPSGKKGHYKAGKQVGFLPQGSEVTIGAKRGNWAPIKAITAGGMISPTSGVVFGSESSHAPWDAPESNDAARHATTTPGDLGWLNLRGHQPITEPKRIGEVVIPSPPIRVKAGTPLGQIGEYQDYERATPLPPTSRRRLFHLEVFADDGFAGFLTRSRARAAQLPANQRSLLVIEAGAKLVRVPAADRKLCFHHRVVEAAPTADSPSSGPWVKVQPKHADFRGEPRPEGPPCWIERRDLGTYQSPIR